MNKVRVGKVKGKAQYFYDFWFDSKRYRKRTSQTRSDTLAAGFGHLRRLEKAKLGLVEPEPVKPTLFEEFADRFMEDYSRVNKRPSSTRSDENSLKHLKPFFRAFKVGDVRPELVERYKAERVRRVSPASVNRELALLKTIMNKAVEWGQIPSNPIAGKRVKKFIEDNRRQRVLTDDETDRLMNKARGILRPFLVIALNTGMRRNEILSLRWADIDFVRGELTVRAEVSKSKRPRTIPVSGLVADTLRGLPKNRSGLVFFNPETGANIKDVKTAFKTACRKAKISGLRVHDLRHTALTRMIETGVDIVTVKEIAGHSSIEITMRYCHPSRETKVRAMEKLAATFNLRGYLDAQVDNIGGKGPVSVPVSRAAAYN